MALIACGASKRDQATAARDLYTGSLFRAARRDVDGRLPWFIASALWALVHPDAVLEPYDFRVEQIPAGRERRLWAHRVAGMLAQEVGAAPRYAATPPGALVGYYVELHAGTSYATPLVPALVELGAEVEVLPPGKLELGHRLQWYAARHAARPVTEPRSSSRVRAARELASPVTPPDPFTALVDRVAATMPGRRADIERVVRSMERTIACAAEAPSLPWAGTLFSGGGLVEVGLRGLVVPVFAVEANADIGAHYRAAHGAHIHIADVRAVDYRPAAGIDYLHASPVCIRFSATRTSATTINDHEQPLDVATAEATARALAEIRPRVFTLENVPAYAASEAMGLVEARLRALGYTYDVGVFDAADYGAATMRRRLLLRAVREGRLPRPPPVTGPGDWFQAIADLVPTFAPATLPAWAAKRLDARGVEWRRPSRPLLVMGGSATKENVPHAFAGGPAPTFKATPKERHRVILPDGRVLTLTPRAIARVTGVPDDYPLPENHDLAVTILGNGVPPPLVRAVFGPLVRR